MSDKLEGLQPTVHGIIHLFLVTHGYDGLCNPDLECGCDLIDLMPCESAVDDCRPGYKGPPTEEQRIDGADWAIWLEKQPAPEGDGGREE